MCGIFGYVGDNGSAAKLVLTGIKSLEYRGYDSWGVAAVAKGKMFIKKRVGKIGDNNVSDSPNSNIAIGHTRWATHGGVTNINAHPHLDCTSSIAIIHNGIFENYELFKKRLIGKGHEFVSETDTETLAHLIEEFKKSNSFSESVRKTFNQMDGLNAIIVIDKNENKIIAARNGSPLIIGFGNNENFLASDASALLPFTKEVYFLEDEEMAVLQKNKVEVFNVRTGKKINFRQYKLNWKTTQAEKGKYPNFMLKEIYEQPHMILGIASNPSLEVRIANIVKKAKGTYLVGCGTASYACLAGQYLFSRIAKCHVNSAIGSEFGYHLEFLNKDSLIIAVSQSGETMDILESIKKAKDAGAKIACLTNSFGSSLYRMSDYKILIGAGPEKAVASTKAFTGMLAHLILLAYTLKGQAGEGQKVLVQSVKSIKKVLSQKNLNNVRKLAKILGNRKHIYVIGRGLSYPTALETALKIKEISYIHAEGLAAGELKHGPLALVEKGTPCIAYLPKDETYGANLAGAMEMHARGGLIIGVSYKPHEVFDYFIKIDDAKEATIISNVVFAQLLAYFLTIRRGFDPDKPRNLAKSVTVR
jgi:glucosamine--fructose-6-phosphate aminotransferase (isomerizing)